MPSGVVPERHHGQRHVAPLAIVGIVAGLTAIALIAALAVTRTGGPPEPRRVGRALPASDPSLAPAVPAASSFARARRPRPRKSVQEPRPERIRIPAIGVNARVVRLGLAPDRTMETPTNYADTGWFAPGPEPGERGAAVIAGHVDSKGGPAVFFKLGKLRRGNLIRITVKGGRILTFKVHGLERWPKAHFPTKRVFGATRAATLRLITCGGTFNSATGHYLDNTIVYAVRRTAGRT